MRGSLKGRIALGTGGLFFLLYAVASALVLVIDARNNRGQLEVLLYAQAESLASYYASSRRLDFPELGTFEQDTPFPVWLRVVKQGKIIAATPGLPRLRVVHRRKKDYGRIEIWRPERGPRLAVVAHEIWNEPGTEVEAFSSLQLLARRERDLLFALGLAGLVLIPLAALAGRLLAAQALKPMDTLVASISALDSDRLEQRLAAPGAVAEIALLADEFNRLLDRLEESVEAMRRFTADASHELRTPISILRTGLEVTLRKERTAAEYREVMRENLEEIERVQRIVEALLTLARSHRGDTREIRREPVDLSAVVDRAVASLRPLAEERSVALDARTAPGLQVEGDPDQLRLLVVNLLDNAVKFTPPGRHIHLRLEGQPDRARLEVRDEGPGVAAEDRPFIFDRFYRAPTTRPTGSATGGLGLAVVRWVAERHGGEVRLLDTEGPGAIFEVLLPSVPRSPTPRSG
jgi:signal transduction histidine kinase